MMRPRILPLLMVFFVVTAACGGGSDGATEGVASLEATSAVETTVAAADIDQEQAAITLIECLRDQGLEVDDPTVDSDGNVQFPAPDPNDPIDQDELEAALGQCEEELQAVIVGFTQDFDFTELEDTLLEYSQCVRDNGFDLPDPDFSNFGLGGDGPPTGPFGNFDFEDSAFVAANEVCDELLSGLGFGG